MTTIKENFTKLSKDTKSNLTNALEASPELEQVLENKARALGKQAREYYEKGSKELDDQVENLSNIIKERPILAISLAVLAGIALCKIVDFIKD